VHVLTIGLQIEDRIADDLSRTVIGDVAAATGFEYLESPGRQRFVGRQNMRATSTSTSATSRTP
jgi:hypothetical protein